MDTFHLGTKTTWENYLKKSSFTKDINGEIRSHRKEEMVAISNQTREIVASQKALTKKFGAGVNYLGDSIDRGLYRLQKAAEGNKEAIEELRSSFDFNMALVVDQLRLQNRTMLGIIDQMEAINNTLQNPTLTQAREFFRIGCERLVRGLLDKALEAFHESEKKNDTDFMTQLLLGKLYLYGVNEECNVIDLKKAEQHLCKSARYAKAEMKLLPEAGQYAGEALLNAAVSCYAQAQNYGIIFKKKEAGRLIRKSCDLADEASKINPELSAGHYHYAKMSALIGKSEEAASSLKKAINLAEDYCLKVDNDQDFRFVRKKVNTLLLELREETNQEVHIKIRKIEKYLTDWVYMTDEAQKAEAQIRQILQEATAELARNTYFDNRDAIGLLEQAELIFQSLLIHKLSLHNLSAHTGCVNTIAFSPDGSILASGGTDQTIKLWSLRGNKLLDTLEGHIDDVNNLMFSHDGTMLASVDKKGGIKLWDVADGFLIQDLLEPASPVYCIAFSPDDSLFAAGSFVRKAIIWNLNDGFMSRELDGHKSSVDTVIFNNAGNLLATGSPDNTAVLWDLNDCKLLYKFQGCSGLSSCLAFSPDDSMLITGANDGSVRFYQIENGELLETLPGQNGTVSWLSLNATGTTLATINYGKALQLWDAVDRKLLYDLKPFSPGISSVKFSPEGTILAASDYQDRSLKLWNTHNGKLANIIAGNLTSSAFSPNGTILVTGDATGSLKIWGRMVTARSEFENMVELSDKEVVEVTDSQLDLNGYREDTLENGHQSVLLETTTEPNEAPPSYYTLPSNDKTERQTEVLVNRQSENELDYTQEEQEITSDRPIQTENILKNLYTDVNKMDSGKANTEDEQDDWKKSQLDRIDRRIKSKRCQVCGKNLNFITKLMGKKSCHRHYHAPWVVHK